MSKYRNKKLCSPHRRKSFEYTCYTLTELKQIASAYNKANPDKKVKTSQTKKELWEDLRKKFTNCNQEACWIKSPKLKENKIIEKIENETFVPPKPPKLLTTSSITNVLKQYQKIYPSFKSLGAMPLDFQKLGITAYKVKKLLKKYNKIGMVVNMDKSNKPGSHWVTMLITPKQVEYFDSYGLKPPKNIEKFIEKLKLPYVYNKQRHQYSESECGMYSIYYIVKRLEGKKFKDFNNKKILDKIVRKYRKEYFRPI